MPRRGHPGASSLTLCLLADTCPPTRAPQVSDGDCPHVLFYGPSGAGKKTLVLALLKELFGPGVERIKVEQKEWKIEVGERKVEVDLTLMSSNYHVEMNPSDAGGTKDRYVVQEVIKDMARGRLIGVEGGKGYKGAQQTMHGDAAGFADSTVLPSAGAERGGQAVARGAARAAAHHGEVLGGVPPHAGMRQHQQGPGRGAQPHPPRAGACRHRGGGV